MTETGDPGVGATAGGWLELTAFQMEVARLFFALPGSAGFLLAGGAALVAQHLSVAIARAKNITPGTFSYGSKVTTAL